MACPNACCSGPLLWQKQFKHCLYNLWIAANGEWFLWQLVATTIDIISNHHHHNGNKTLGRPQNIRERVTSVFGICLNDGREPASIHLHTILKSNCFSHRKIGMQKMASGIDSKLKDPLEFKARGFHFMALYCQGVHFNAYTNFLVPLHRLWPKIYLV